VTLPLRRRVQPPVSAACDRVRPLRVQDRAPRSGARRLGVWGLAHPVVYGATTRRYRLAANATKATNAGARGTGRPQIRMVISAGGGAGRRVGGCFSAIAVDIFRLVFFTVGTSGGLRGIACRCPRRPQLFLA